MKTGIQLKRCKQICLGSAINLLDVFACLEHLNRLHTNRVLKSSIGVPRGLILGPLLFLLCISYFDTIVIIIEQGHNVLADNINNTLYQLNT